MKRIFLSITFLLLITSLLQAQDNTTDIAGYGKTKWAMTEDEVLKAEAPRVKKLPKRYSPHF